MIENIPDELRQTRQWVVWKEYHRPGKKPAKKPYRPWGPRAQAANVLDPGTWGTFDQATKHAANGGGFNGIGLMFAGELVGIDLDNVIDENGQVQAWAVDVVQAVNSYTEVSPTGTGLHILAWGVLPTGRRRRGQVEMYDKSSPRFFTMTGNVYGSHTTIHRRQAEIDAIHATHLGPGDDEPVETSPAAEELPAVASGDELLDKALAANSNMAALWAGDISSYGDDASRADLGLCRHLAFWTAKDAAAIDKYFRQSGLMRDKWNEKHGAATYGEMTIKKAIATTTQVYTPPKKAAAKSPAGKTTDGKRPNIDLRNPKTVDYFKAFEFLGYAFRLNLLDNSIEMNSEPLNDGLEAQLRNKMRDIGLGNPIIRVSDSYIELAYQNQYHPIKDWLDALVWDGKDDITYLAEKYMKETTKFGPVALRRWMVGSVAKIYQQAQNFMLVIDGPQGVGKSRFTRWLCPLPQFFLEGPIRPEDKDYLLRMATTWVWEVAELQATTRKADREALKGVLTMQEITVRPAYAKHTITKPTMTSFIGTINEDGAGFLTDTTGNRRYVIIRVEKFDWNYERELKIENLWAQAVHMYKSGEPWALTDREELVRDAINEEYQLNSVVAVSFFEHYDIDTNRRDQYTTLHDILSTLRADGLTGNQQTLMSEVSRILKQRGAEPFRARQGMARPTAYRGVFLRGKDTGV